MIIYNFVNGIFKIVELAILIECITSFIPDLRYNQYVQMLHNITDPILEPCRDLQNKLSPNLPLDFSPMIALLIMDVIRRILIGIIF